MNTNKWQAPRIGFVGTATSHFQSQPAGWLGRPGSDWDAELYKYKHGLPSAVKVRQDPSKFPALLDKSKLYIKRSGELGCNMFRVSFDLPRLCPQIGSFDEALMADYVRLLVRIRLSGQEPMVTLHHFTMPLYYTQFSGGTMTHGAWEHPTILAWFNWAVRRAVGFLSNKAKIRGALADGGISAQEGTRFVEEGLLKYVMTINEPGVTLGNSYLSGAFPPFKKGRIGLMLKVLNTMVDAHYCMSDQVRELGIDYPACAPKIGIGYFWNYVEGLGSSVAAQWDRYYTNQFERRVESDWIGLHHYCRFASLFGPPARDREMSEHPGFGDVYPEGVLTLATRMHRSYPAKPMFISEVGFSDKTDRRRPYWILETVKYILEAKRQGAPIEGVLLWSLVDNFEWDLGMSQHFGLFAEAQLSEPLKSDGSVHSWQVWQAVAELLRRPSTEAQAKIEQLYQRAKMQHAAYHEARR
ncbi:MAG: glycoside hydrolase family 1 protein [Patescibacteria group bacterium]|nr:glycoside hydrolase family 1 protein [Patescibacteria group bacterium]